MRDFRVALPPGVDSCFAGPSLLRSIVSQHEEEEEAEQEENDAGEEGGGGWLLQKLGYSQG